MQFADSQAALQSEKVLLQSILLNNDLMYLAESVTPEDLQTDYHRQMLIAMREKILSGASVDEVVLYEHFKRVGGAGIANYVVDFDGVSTKNIEPHIQEIKRASQRRKIISVLEEGVAQSRDLSEGNADVLSVVQDRLLALQQSGAGATAERVADFSDKFYSHLESVANHETGIGAYTTGNAELDTLTTGIRLGEYVIVAGWTSDGKTAYASQIITANCQFGAKVFIFSQEMSREAIIQRCIPQVMNGNLPAYKLRNPRLMNGTDRALLRESKVVIDKWNLWVDDTASLHVRDLVARAYIAHRKHGVKLFIVDYLQLAKGDGDKKNEQVSNVSTALRNFSHNEGVAVVALSQFGRPEGKVKRRPSLFDLKESGDIENDANLVLFVYRPLTKEGGYTYEDLLIVGKQREGPVGDVKVEFDKDSLTFRPRTGTLIQKGGTWHDQD